jgi:hypothetical protein
MRVVRLNRPMLQRRIFGVAELLAFVWWLSSTLSFFELRTPLITSSEAALRTNLTIGSLSISLGQVLVFVVAVWASFGFDPREYCGRMMLQIGSEQPQAQLSTSSKK